MLDDYMEDFILLECTHQPDNLGGSRTAYQESMAFRGGVTSVMTREATVAQASA